MFFRDRFRTAVNVLGDSYGAGIVDHLCRNDLPPLDEGDETSYQAMELPEKVAQKGTINGGFEAGTKM